MAMNEADDNGIDRADPEVLSCGADLDDLWGRGHPAPGHASCPECHRALASLDALRHTVRTALEEDHDEEDHAATALLDRVMTAVRTEIRPGPLVPLGEERDDDWITEAAAARVLRSAVDELPGVCAGSCRIRALRERHAAGLSRTAGRSLPRGPLSVDIEVFIDLSRTIPRTVALVRGAVADAATRRIGLDVRLIDVVVRDLITPEEQA